MEFLILGATQLLVGDAPVDLGSTKQRQLLGWLLFHVGQPMRAETLALQLWPEKPWPTVKSVLHQLISRTRRVLAEAGLPEALVTIPHTRLYRLDLDPKTIDYYRFVDMSRRSQRLADHEQFDAAAELLSRALILWRGEPLAELVSDEAERLRDHLADTVWLPACRLLIDCQIKSGAYEAAHARLELLLPRYGNDQTLAGQWMETHIAAGRPHEACSFFLRFRQRLHLDNDEPAPDLIALYQTARQHRAPATPAQPPRQRLTLTPPQQTPRDLREFTGQHRALAELDSLTGDHAPTAGLIVIDGMPGVGKTALVIHWAHRHRGRFPDGQLFVNAGGYGPGAPISPHETLGRFLQALGVPGSRIPGTTDDRHDLFNQILTGRSVLIVIDNIRDADHLRPLLTSAPHCVTLVTSRAWLAPLAVHDGAHTITLPPFDDADRTALLRRILGTARANQEPDALDSLGRVSGGLPLALRIIAEHIRVRPRARLADLVDDLGQLLLADGGTDDAHLATVFSWSYKALDPNSRSLFRRIGLFPGRSIGVGAAAVLLDSDGGSTGELLNTLAAAHLIEHDTAHHYRIHDLLHQYAARRAESEEPEHQRHHLRHRLLDWYLLSGNNAAARLSPSRTPVPGLPRTSAVTPLSFSTDAEALHWCEQERDNIGALTRYAADQGFRDHAWQLPNTMHEIYERYERQDDVLASLEIALQCARTLSNNEAIIGTLNNLGTACFAVHDPARGVSLFEEGLRLARAQNHREGQAVCTHNLARFHMELDNFATAIKFYQNALAIYRDIGEPSGEAFSLHRLGDVHRHLDRYTEALAYYNQALAIRERIGSLRGQGNSHAEIARIHLELDQPERALVHCRRALDIHASTHDQGMACDAWTTMAAIHQRLGTLTDAYQDVQIAMRLADRLGDPDRVTRARRIYDTVRATATSHPPADSHHDTPSMSNGNRHTARDTKDNRVPNGAPHYEQSSELLGPS